MSRIKEYPSITSFDGTNDALAIEQTDGANNRTRKVSPAQLKQFVLGGSEALKMVNLSRSSTEITDPVQVIKDNYSTLLSNYLNIPIVGKIDVGSVYYYIGTATNSNYGSFMIMGYPDISGHQAIRALKLSSGVWKEEDICFNPFIGLVRTATVTGTTNGYADVALGINSDYLVLSVTEVTNSGGCYAIPRMVESGNWYACVYRQNAKLANTSVTLQVKYVPMT